MKKNASEKMWAILIHLSSHMWWKNKDTKLSWEEEAWDYIIDGAADAGFNTIVLDVGDGIEFSSHPEIAVEGAWTKGRLKKEIKRCKEKGITLIPKLNFATTHDKWLGIYARMVSTPEYYRVCNDLIREVYELFEQPEYIHIGMDEENNFMQLDGGAEIVIYRRGELLWHDLRFLVDAVNSTGAKAWIWHDIAYNQVDEFKKRFAPDEVILAPWYYRAFHEENFEPMPPERQAEFGNLNLTYLEEGFFFANFRKVACPLAHEGYKSVPTSSAWSGRSYNAFELMEHFELGAPDDTIIGHMTAPWCGTKIQFKEVFERSFSDIKKARAHFYED